MKNNRDKLIVLLFTVGLVVVMTFGFSIINSVNQTHQQLNNEVQFLRQLVRDMEYNISETINRDLEEANSDIHSVDVQYLSAEPDSQEVTVDVLVTLKETNAEDAYTLKLTGSQSLEGRSYILTYVDGTTYKLTLSLPIMNNYTFNVTEEKADGAKRLMSTVESDLPIRDELSYDRINLMQHHIGLDSGEFMAGFDLNITDYQLDAFGLQHVTIEVWHDGNQVVNQDITDQLTREPSHEMEEYYTGASMSDDAYYYDDVYYDDGTVEEQNVSDYFYNGSFRVDGLRDVSLDHIVVHVKVETHDGVIEHFALTY